MTLRAPEQRWGGPPLRPTAPRGVSRLAGRRRNGECAPRHDRARVPPPVVEDEPHYDRPGVDREPHHPRRDRKNESAPLEVGHDVGPLESQLTGDPGPERLVKPEDQVSDEVVPHVVEQGHEESETRGERPGGPPFED